MVTLPSTLPTLKQTIDRLSVLSHNRPQMNRGLPEISPLKWTENRSIAQPVSTGFITLARISIAGGYRAEPSSLEQTIDRLSVLSHNRPQMNRGLPEISPLKWTENRSIPQPVETGFATLARISIAGGYRAQPSSLEQTIDRLSVLSHNRPQMNRGLPRISPLKWTG